MSFLSRLAFKYLSSAIAIIFFGSFDVSRLESLSEFLIFVLGSLCCSLLCLIAQL